MYPMRHHTPKPAPVMVKEDVQSEERGIKKRPSYSRRGPGKFSIREHKKKISGAIPDFETQKEEGIVNLESGTDDPEIVLNVSTKKVIPSNKDSIADTYAFTGMHHIFSIGENVSRMKFGNDNRDMLVFSTCSGFLHIADLSLNPPTVVVEIHAHSSKINDFNFSVMNEYIITCSFGEISIWNSTDGLLTRKINVGKNVNISTSFFHPLNNNIIICSADKAIKIFNFSTGKLVQKIPTRNAITAMTTDIDGEKIYIGHENGEIEWLQCTNPGLFTTFEREASSRVSKSPITSMEYRGYHTSSFNLPSLLIDSEESNVTLLRFARSRHHENNLILKKWAYYPTKQQTRISSSFCPLILARDRACVVSGASDGSVFILGYSTIKDDIKAKEPFVMVNKLQGHSAPVSDISWNYDESYLASSDTTGMIIVWKRS